MIAVARHAYSVGVWPYLMLAALIVFLTLDFVRTTHKSSSSRDSHRDPTLLARRDGGDLRLVRRPR